MIAPNSAAEPAAATTGEGFDELAVANASFFIDKLGAECGDLRGLRELSVNGIEAIPAQGEDATGRVVWNVDWQRLDATAGRERKLSVIDTGIGVTTEAMRFVINHLAVSSRDRGANFGVGAKVTAGSRKPEGLEYRSWQGGRGALIRFRGHEDGRWGLDPQTGSDGHTPASGAHSARTTIRGCCAEPATVRWTTLATSSSEQFSSTNSHGHVFTADGADAALPSLTPFDLAGAADRPDDGDHRPRVLSAPPATAATGPGGGVHGGRGRGAVCGDRGGVHRLIRARRCPRGLRRLTSRRP